MSVTSSGHSCTPAAHPSYRELLWPFLLCACVVIASTQSRLAGPTFTGFDKLAHFCVYAWLGILLARCTCIASLRPLGIYSAIVLTSFFGATDELHQHFTPGRSMEFADWLADTLGASLGVVLYQHVPRLRALLESPLTAPSFTPHVSR